MTSEKLSVSNSYHDELERVLYSGNKGLTPPGTVNAVNFSLIRLVRERGKLTSLVFSMDDQDYLTISFMKGNREESSRKLRKGLSRDVMSRVLYMGRMVLAPEYKIVEPEGEFSANVDGAKYRFFVKTNALNDPLKVKKLSIVRDEYDI